MVLESQKVENLEWPSSACIGFIPGSLRGSDPLDFGMEGSWGSWDLHKILFHPIKCTEIWDENTFHSGDFSDIERFVFKIKILGMIPSIQCYMPPSVELLEPATPSFQTRLTPLSACKKESLSSCHRLLSNWFQDDGLTTAKLLYWTMKVGLRCRAEKSATR